MITRLLIANRGEIAIRIIRACAELGIESVAVYSDADAKAPHVLAADHAVAIGPAPAHESYLSVPTLLDAARTSGANAIHPGYGFLSENAAFAEACAGAGLIFVGLPADVIAQMGSKIRRRRRQRHAQRPRRARDRRVDPGGPARVRGGVRRRDAVCRTAGGAPTARRGADLRRQSRPRAAPVRARLLDAAAPSEGD